MPVVVSSGTAGDQISDTDLNPYNGDPAKADQCVERYDGDKPWTNGAVTTVKYKPVDKWIWTRQKPTEPWAACLYPKTDLGFGVYSPECANSIWNMGWTGRGKDADKKGGTEYSAPTMHFAPLADWKLERNSKRTFRYWIIIGNLKDIRSRVHQLAKLYPEHLK